MDAATAELLRSAEAGAQLVGPDGRPVGGFVPRNLLYVLQHALEDHRRAIDEANAAVSLEDLRRADAAGGGIPHDEVLRRLGLPE